MSKHQLKKFERSKTPPRFKVGEGDLQILQEVADYRFLDTRHILALHPDMAERTLKRRLELMFRAGLLDRPPQQLSYYRASSHIIYALGRQGARLVLSGKAAELDWTAKNKRVKSLFLRHGLMIANFRLILTLALQTTKHSRLVNWQIDDLSDRVEAEGLRLPVRPDAFLTIEDKDDWLHFFLEADRSTMNQQRFLDKMKAYWHYWQQDRQRKKFEISKFRVLSITISEERNQNLRQISRQADDSRQGSRMFWFACEKSYNLDKPATILEPIWQTPQDDTYHHLLE